jgi:hypothetical protein
MYLGMNLRMVREKEALQPKPRLLTAPRLPELADDVPDEAAEQDDDMDLLLDQAFCEWADANKEDEAAFEARREELAAGGGRRAAAVTGAHKKRRRAPAEQEEEEGGAAGGSAADAGSTTRSGRAVRLRLMLDL